MYPAPIAYLYRGQIMSDISFTAKRKQINGKFMEKVSNLSTSVMLISLADTLWQSEWS